MTWCKSRQILIFVSAQGLPRWLPFGRRVSRQHGAVEGVPWRYAWPSDHFVAESQPKP